MSEKESSNANGADGESKVTAADVKFFTVMFKHLPQKLDIDWDEFAKEMGLKNPGVAKTRLGQIRSKLGLTRARAGNGLGTSIKPANTNNKIIKAPKTTKTAKMQPQKCKPKAASDGATGGVKDEEMNTDDTDN
ncbi:hypothetical protein GQX73_g10312 [Xylaria multiplex]|uniref:Uncharacterized protein n=1 Tax=Xylaria multiplex TaxID=323545 RepID=A0A7C8IKE5_9PEZI|nr:hypothetical protein GQX73_g10312 [Xylaria multiplex]